MNLLDQLAGGDRRSIGSAKRVALEVLRHPEQLGNMVQGLHFSDAVIRGRAAHVIMQTAQTDPKLVQPFKLALIEVMAQSQQWEVRLELAKTITRLVLAPPEHHRLILVFKSWLDAPQSFVKTGALQGLADLDQLSGQPDEEIKTLLSHYAIAGTAAMRARCRKLLKQYEP